VKVKFLFAGYGLAVSGSGVEGPLLDCCDDGFVDAVTQAAGHLDVGDFASGVDDNVEDDVAFGAAGQDGEIRLGSRKVTGESDVDVARAQGIRASGGVGVRRGGGVGVWRGCGGFRLLGWRGWDWPIRFNLLRKRFRVRCGRLGGGAAGQVSDAEVGSVLVAREADGSNEGGALVNQNEEQQEM
jgi:hypothetical protein